MNQLEEFKALGLSDDILTAIAKKGFETPSAIQSLTIPHLLTTDNDIIAQSQTGTGKTAAFGLPILQMLDLRRRAMQAIILVPTRELALQAPRNSFVTTATTALDHGHLRRRRDERTAAAPCKRHRHRRRHAGARARPHPPRHARNLDNVRYLVLDEADEMLNMGFVEDVEEIMSHTGAKTRVLLFSATMPERIIRLSQLHARTELLRVESQHVTADLTNQIYFEVREGRQVRRPDPHHRRRT